MNTTQHVSKFFYFVNMLKELIKKFDYYKNKYGIFHATFSYIGRQHLPIWHLLGPTITHRYMNRWLATTQKKVINLGGGSNCLEGCLTVDVDPRADAYVNITKPLPFETSSIQAIFCEEVIEHISLVQGKAFLSECWRILVPGGVMRITTPDLNWFIEHATLSVSDCNNINEIFYNHGHQYIYTQQALEHYCREAGFCNISRSTYQDANSQLSHLDSHANRFNHIPQISQYLEIKKPETR